MAAAAITWVPKPNVEVWPVDPPPPVNFNKTAEQEYGDKEVKLPHWTPTLHTFQVPQNYTKANCTYCNTREYTFSYHPGSMGSQGTTSPTSVGWICRTWPGSGLPVPTSAIGDRPTTSSTFIGLGYISK